jgi:hypothetical protein
MLSERIWAALIGLAFVGCSSGPASGPGDSGTKTDSGADTSAPPPDTGTPDTGTSPEAEPAESAADVVVDSGPAYPKGPYGTAAPLPEGGVKGCAKWTSGGGTAYNVGDVVDPSLEWQGYEPGAKGSVSSSSGSTTLHMPDFYDPDGSKGINAIVIDTSAQWCIACQGEAQFISTWMGSTGAGAGEWAALGVKFVTLVVETATYDPATLVTAEQWRTEQPTGCTGGTCVGAVAYVASDPCISFSEEGLPHNLLIDPRTMKVFVDMDNDPVTGSGSVENADPNVAALASCNKKGGKATAATNLQGVTTVSCSK